MERARELTSRGFHASTSTNKNTLPTKIYLSRQKTLKKRQKLRDAEALASGVVQKKTKKEPKCKSFKRDETHDVAGSAIGRYKNGVLDLGKGMNTSKLHTISKKRQSKSTRWL